MASPAPSRPGCPGRSAPPPAPNPRQAPGYSSASAWPLRRHRRRASSSTSGFAQWEEGGVGPGRRNYRGRGDVLTSAPHPRPPSTCVRSLTGGPGLFLWDQGAPSCMVQDGDLGRRRKESEGEDNDESPQMGGGPGRGAVVAKSEGPEEETV